VAGRSELTKLKPSNGREEKGINVIVVPRCVVRGERKCCRHGAEELLDKRLGHGPRGGSGRIVSDFLLY